MAKIKDEDRPGFIPENERQPDLEKEIQYYLSFADTPKFVSKKRYTPTKYPTNFRTTREEEDYQVEELRRLKFGYDGLSGKGYGFLNYAWVRDPEKGKIRPEFRSKQEEFFQKVESLEQNPGRGIVGFKRRRVGYSTVEAWDALQSCMTKKFTQIGMNSKSENDSRNLFTNVKFIYQNLPDWLRPRATASDRRDFMHFAWYDRDSSGNKITRGLESWISSVAPTDNAHEGQAYSKLIIDEAGKIPNLLNIWQYAEDCLRVNTRRVGIPLIMGTVGDIDKDGKGLMELYKNNDAYSLDRFVFYGYNGLIVDEFGNDMIEDAIRWVIYERHRLKSANRKLQLTFLQKYPLCENDAFNQVSEGGIGNVQLINDQIVKLVGNQADVRRGWMRANVEGGVDFVPNPDGKIVVYELPNASKINGYVAGGDTADHDDKKRKLRSDVSELAIAIVAKPFGTEPPKLVLEYVDRPQKLDAFFEQAAMALKWYNNTKVLIEDNRARMINYFKFHHRNLLPLVPASILAVGGKFEMKNSVTMTEIRKQQMIGLIEDNIDHYSQFIPSIKLLEQFKVFGGLHADDDLAIAYGWALVMLQADKRAVQMKEEQDKQRTTSYRYERVGGMVRIITPTNQNYTRKIPKGIFG